MPDARRCLALGAALATIAIALSPPMDGAADSRLSGHMVQHVLLVSVAAPLLAISHPLRGLGARWRGPRLGAGVTLAVAGAVQVGVLVGWHVPALYDAALEHERVHGFEHLTLLLSATCLWWALGRLSGEAAGLSVLALFVVTLPAMALGVAMTLARTPWYPGYAAHNPDALADQQLAGVVMWAYAGLAAFVGAVVITVGWLNQLERANPGVPVAAGVDAC
jgi:cytochrome c oxidase assembly factor CtaG